MMRMSQTTLVGFLLFSLAAVFVACSAEESPPKNDGSSSGGEETDSGSGTTTADANKPADAAPSEASTKKGLGETCENDDSCESGHCFAGGTGGGTGSSEPKCTLACAVKAQDNAPECTGKPGLTGKCNGKNFCQLATDQ